MLFENLYDFPSAPDFSMMSVILLFFGLLGISRPSRDYAKYFYRLSCSRI
jgi:hypothetical protein